MTYRRTIQVEFNHCDPAGIVFYPRYFELTNSVTENFFADVVGRSYAQMTMRDGNGVPTVKIEADFRAPSRLGDRLDFTLDIARLGHSSVTLAIAACGEGEIRIEARLTLVWVSTEGRAAPWPEEMRVRMQAFMEGKSL
ncbi:thioesterase family protein [Frigidibacter sp. RF13]|uniref:acyl-CoA thioesterase n=1 Tax=Frigidibacter sp. RF13 TaxID=2997340 RepID=UPI0022701E9C|nr:thioesterase family protein [Frigidibacter sp. RF13]MCY1125267.1 thioesterase family protein [Frigidibacter sp. RF13]